MQNLNQGWRSDDAVLPVCELILRDMPYFLHCTTYISTYPYSNSIQTTQPTDPPHTHTPLLLNTEEKVGLLPGSMQQIPSPCSAIHPWTIHDPCTIGWIGTLLAETGWPSILTSPSSKICWVNCKTRSSGIFIVLFFLVWKLSFRSFSRINLDFAGYSSIHWTLILHFTPLHCNINCVNWEWTELTKIFFLT